MNYRACWFAVLLAGCAPPPPPDPLTRGLAEVAGHRFWKAKVNSVDVRKMLEIIQAEPSSSVVVIDDRGKTVVFKDLAAGLPSALDRKTRSMFVSRAMAEKMPKEMSERQVTFLLADEFAARPDLETILSKLRAKIAVRDYED